MDDERMHERKLASGTIGAVRRLAYRLNRTAP